MSSIDQGRPAVARLIERLLSDESFRRAFRRNPAQACRAYGLDDLADELSAGSSVQTLELRESKSSLAGAVMALAAEGFGIGELSGLLSHGAHAQGSPVAPGHGSGLELAASKGELGGGGHAAEAAGQVVHGPAHGAAAAAVSETSAAAGTPAGAAGLTELLANPRLSMPAQVRSALVQGGADPRVVAVLQDAVAHHTVVLGDLQSVTDPVHAESVSIVSVDGQPVGPTNIAARDLLTEIAALDPSVRPTEIASPWPIHAPGFFSDPSHPGELRLSFVTASDARPAQAQMAGSSASPAQDAGTPAVHQGSAAAPTPTPQGTGSSAAPGGYVNPLPAGAQIGRTDMGVDVDLKPGEPIIAIGKSRVLGIMPSWYKGQPYLALQLLDGPLKGHNYYVAEQIDPAVAPGQVVQAGQVIAHYAATGTGIEIGWAGPNWEQTLAQAQGNTGDAAHNDAPAGLSFHKFLVSLAHAQGGQAWSGSDEAAAASDAAPTASTASSAGARGVADPPAPPAPKPATAVFAAVEHGKRRVFQRQTVEFRAASPSPDSPPSPGSPSPATPPAPHAMAAQVPAQAVDVASGSISVSSSLLTGGQEQFAARLAQLTGLDPRVISAWELAEESGAAAKSYQARGYFNWLNIGQFDSGPGQIAFSAAFKDPITAAELTARFLKGTSGGASSSIRAILATVGRSAQRQISAIAASDWASSHYGGGANLRATYDDLADIQITRK